MSRGARIACSIIVSTVAGLTLAEVAVRLLPVAPRRFRVAAVERRKNGFHRHGRGPKPPDGVRILVLGDSFTWGAGVNPDDAYPERLERRFRELGGTGFEVLNAGLAGWNTAGELEVLSGQWQERPAYPDAYPAIDPDLVLVGYCLNDPKLTNNQPGQDVTRRRDPARGWIGGWPYRASALYRMAWERIENARQRREMTRYYHRLHQGREWQGCLAAFGQMEATLRAHGVPLVVVVFPVFDAQIDSRYPYRDLHARVCDALGELGIPSLDLLPAYEGVDARRLAVVPFTDAHPSEIAHRIAADRILRYLLEQDYLRSWPHWLEWRCGRHRGR